MDSKKKKIDMTTGPILRNIFLFAIPMVLGNVLQQLYTTVDTLVIGNYCGDTSLAAVGTSSQPVEVLLCIFLGIGTGVSILVSQCVGRKDEEGVRTLCETAISFVYIIGVPLGVIGWFTVPLILKGMDVPEDAWNEALIYTRVILLGTLGNIGYNMNAGILRGLGDSKASLWFLVISCISNIVLDLALVAGLKMDVSGAALSTSIAMFISWFASIRYILRRFPELHFTVLPKRLSVRTLRRIIAIGLPIGLNNSLYSFGHVAIQTLVNAQGSVFMAGNSVAGRITGLSNIAITGMSSAASTFSGQNYGARNFDRLRSGYMKIPLLSGAITLSFGLFFILIHRPIIGFFSDDPTVLMYASRYVVVVLLSQWMYAVFNGLSNIVQGTGRVKYTTLVNILMLWAVRIPSAYLIAHYYDGTWNMLCFPISFGFGMLCMLGYCIINPSWKAVLRGEEQEKMQSRIKAA